MFVKTWFNYFIVSSQSSKIQDIHLNRACIFKPSAYFYAKIKSYKPSYTFITVSYFQCSVIIFRQISTSECLTPLMSHRPSTGQAVFWRYFYFFLAALSGLSFSFKVSWAGYGILITPLRLVLCSCYWLNVCILPKFLCCNLTSNLMFGGRNLGKSLGHEGKAFTEWN